MSDLEEAVAEIHHQPSDETPELKDTRNRRKILKGRISRAIKRVRENIRIKDKNIRRFTKELSEIKRDTDTVRDINNSLYNLVPASEIVRLDKWDDDLISDIFSIEEELEDYIKLLECNQSLTEKSSNNESNTSTPSANVNPPEQDEIIIQTSVESPLQTQNEPTPSSSNVPASNLSTTSTPDNHPDVRQRPPSSDVFVNNQSPHEHLRSNEMSQSVDSWIDKLHEFTETNLSCEMKDLSVAEALLKLEASRDIPSVQIPKFNGDPLTYVEFIEKFRIHIHNKSHLRDDMRMIQLKMHLEGEASRVIAGMGNQGIMYVSALKTLKEEFGQRSVIARTYISKLTRGAKLMIGDRNKLRELSMDIIGCIATLKQINYEADINATENLRTLIKRLPDPLIESWKNKVTDIREKGEVPNIEHISNFVRKKVRSLFDPDFGDIVKTFNKCDNAYKSFPRNQQNLGRAVHSTQRTFDYLCPICGSNHRVFECATFKSLSYDAKVAKIKELRLCFCCLNKGHITRDCRKKKSCNINGCTRIHNQLLHIDPPISSGVSTLDRAGMLPVLRVKVRSPNGKYRLGNLLLDSGAASTLIRTSFSRGLGLQGQSEPLNLAVVGGKRIEQKYSRRLKFFISSLDGGEEYEIEAHEINETVISVPELDKVWLKSFDHLRDIDFVHECGDIDIILGVQYSHLHAEEEIRQGLPFEPLARKSKLGWYVIGPEKNNKLMPLCSVNFVEKINIQQFYDFETLGVRAPDCNCPISPLSLEDKHTLRVFDETCTLTKDRYTIGLPWKRDPSLLPNNYLMAEKRLLSLEKQLSKDPVKAELYNEVINGYEKNGWACRVEPEKVANCKFPVYYLPHHGVYRPDKPSTPLRVVFDPASPVNGVSLNSFLCKGPCLIGNLLGVLIRFRENNIAFTGDISKMFLQICLEEKDTHVHRFLWRNLDSSAEPTIFRLLRVTFGDKPSPAMASFVMLRIAEENKETFPEAANILQRDRYMDDLIHSCATPEEAVECINQLETVLKSASFKIKEWFCSSQRVCQNLTNSVIRESTNLHDISSLDFNLDGERDTKTLGIGWNSESDIISFSVKDIIADQFTKRSVLSKISMFYDPLGLATAVTIRARIAMQDIWRLKSYDWDDILPDEIRETWNDIFTQIVQLRTVAFPRCIKPKDAIGLPELHVFADSSILAYGAVAYLLWNTHRGSQACLISAKARVAPLHQTTIPRLELMAALIASRLAKTIFDELRNKPSRVIIWSDSQVVLFWLRSESATLKAFVGVRVAEIQATWDNSSFRYVPSGLNPADDLSRGIPVEKLYDRWMNGPNFLYQPESEWPVETHTDQSNTELEFKNTKTLCQVSKSDNFIDIERYSSWPKLVRVTAYCLRFVDKLLKRSDTTERVLQLEEIQKAENLLIIHAQSSLIDWGNRYRDLAPFKKDGIVRVGGRLRKSPLEYSEIHPVLLSPDCYISKLIVRDCHAKNGHCGSERTLSDIRRKFWIVRGRCIVKGVIRNCVTCRKLRQPVHSTLMADLPADRLKPFSPPFSVTGVDLFGPFNLKVSRNKCTKAWGVIFTCGTVRAIHLDIVENLSTQAFLHTVRRFAAQHGWPSVFISDNGSNFVGAQKQLKQLVQEGKKQIEDFALLHKVCWKFNTPLSPHQGGMFESLIKQVKNALKISVGEQTLSWNEMSTVFAEVKCLVNSRPITYSSSDPNDFQPITPNHFILGRATTEIPQGPFQETKNLHKRFEFVQSIVSRTFTRLVKEYFPTLMRRSKWQRKERQLQINDIVLLADPNVSRGKWQLARIIEVYPGSDGVVRNLKVHTNSGDYKRSVQKCCPVLEAM